MRIKRILRVENVPLCIFFFLGHRLQNIKLPSDSPPLPLPAPLLLAVMEAEGALSFFEENSGLLNKNVCEQVKFLF